MPAQPSDEHRNEELARLLDEISYEVTAARSAGLGRVDDLRAALRRARDLVAQADALASSLLAARRDADA